MRIGHRVESIRMASSISLSIDSDLDKVAHIASAVRGVWGNCGDGAGVAPPALHQSTRSIVEPPTEAAIESPALERQEASQGPACKPAGRAAHGFSFDRLKVGGCLLMPTSPIPYRHLSGDLLSDHRKDATRRGVFPYLLVR